MLKQSALIKLVSCVALLSGVVNFYSALHPLSHQPHHLLRDLLPLEFLHFPRSYTLLIGLALIVSSVNLWQRKRRAWQIVLALAGFSVLFHWLKRDSLEQALLSLLLFGLLLWLRRQFTVRSRQPDWRGGIVKFALIVCAAFSYGAAGFWLLDVRQFGINFHWADAIYRTLRFLTFIGDSSLAPQTRYAVWFLDSLYVLSATGVVYALFALFRPILYHYHTLPQERAQAAEIIRQDGRSSLDFFKLWPDKTFFFNAAHDCFIAYSVDKDFAVALADPVGPAKNIETTLRAFRQYCEDNGWGIAFHQTLPDFLPDYQRAGFKKLKIGDDALVELAHFNVNGAARRKLRQAVTRLEKSGVRYVYGEPPHSDELLRQLQEVSEDWLSLPGRRERTFSLGLFDRNYVRATPIAMAQDATGRIQAFVNVIPSFRPGATTVDLMRHRVDAPNGIMDFLFVHHFAHCRAQGFAQFDLGMVPLSNFTEKEEASATERAVAYFLRHLDFLFSFGGLKHFKAKYADHWEPRYVIYRHVLELPRLGIAMTKIAELNRYPARLAIIHNALSSGTLLLTQQVQKAAVADSVAALSNSQTTS